MSSDWIAGRVLTPSLDEVVEGALPCRGRADQGPNARFGYPLRGGCEMFVAGLARRVADRGGAFALSRTLVKLDPIRRRATFRVEEPGRRGRPPGDDLLRGRSIPAFRCPTSIDARSRGALEAVRIAAADLPSTAVVCVNLGINREKVTEKHWIYYPEAQG